VLVSGLCFYTEVVTYLCAMNRYECTLINPSSHSITRSAVGSSYPCAYCGSRSDGGDDMLSDEDLRETEWTVEKK
jgi:hypothetical protein